MGILDAPASISYPNSSGRTGVAPRTRGVDVRDYLPAGTPLDGSVDVAPYVKPLLSASYNKSVYFPPGTYLFKAQAQTMLLYDNTRVWAEPGTVTILFDTDTPGAYREFARNLGVGISWSNITVRRNSDFPAVMFPIQAQPGFTFQGMTLDGQRDLYTQYCHGMQIGVQNTSVADGLVVRDSTLTKLTYALFQTNASTATTRNVRFDNCRFVRNYATDLEFNAPIGIISGVRVTDCYFADNQSSGTGGGFAVGLAHCDDVKIARNTIIGYANEAIHVEDYSTDVTVDDNSISQCGLQFTGVIQVISGSSNVRITKNRISTATNTNSITVINLLAGSGGGSTTPGGRPAVAPSRVTVHGNMVTVGGTTTGLYAESVLLLTVTGNQFYGPGNVTSGSYGGPFTYAMHIYTGANTTISDNIFSGFTYGIRPQHQSVATFGNGSIVAGNTFIRCLLALPLTNIDSVTVTGNKFDTCVSSMIVGQGNLANNSAVVANNHAVGCANPMSIYGTVTVTSSAAVATGVGRTVTTAGLRNTLPVGTIVQFTGGATVTLTAIATFDQGFIVGDITDAAVTVGEGGVAYFPYSSNSAKGRTLTGNSDDYWGAAGYGAKIKSTSANYRILGHEHLVVATVTGVTVTLPPVANQRGMAFTIKNAAAGAITVASVSGLIDAATTASVAAGSSLRVVSDGSTWWAA